jgi:hypothetical protein
MAQKVQIPPDLIGGDVDEGYGKVADAFRRNLSSGREVGAAMAVYRDGRKVVDLWGGYRNGITRAPWERLRDEQAGLPPGQRSAGSRSAARAIPRRPGDRAQV